MQKFINGMLFTHSCSLSDVIVGASDEKDILKKILEKYGVLVIKGFFDNQKALELGRLLRALALKAKEDLGSHKFKDCDSYFAQCDLEKFKNYSQISQSPKPVFNLRSKEKGVDDAGFIDFFGVQRLFENSNIFQEVITTIDNSHLPSVINELSGFCRQQMNLYVNEGITQTRGPHIDNLHGSYKCFLYLSDVNELSDGPYTYVPGSHKGRMLKKLNSRYNKLLGVDKLTDMPVPDRLSLRFLGQAGTLIVSCQSGIHGGHPQIESAKRTLLVDNYY